MVSVRTYLRWTGQHRTISAAFGLFLLSAWMGMAVSPLEWIDLDHPMGPVILLSGLALTGLSFVGLCVFVRCPRCRARLLWHAVSKDAHPHGLNGLLLATKCPFCSFPEEPSEAV